MNLIWADKESVNLERLARKLQATSMEWHSVTWSPHLEPRKNMVHDLDNWIRLYSKGEGVVGVFTPYHLDWIPIWWDKPIYHARQGLIHRESLPRDPRPAIWCHNSNAKLHPLWSKTLQHYVHPCSGVHSYRNQPAKNISAILATDFRDIPKRYIGDDNMPIYLGRELDYPGEAPYPCVWEQIQGT